MFLLFIVISVPVDYLCCILFMGEWDQILNVVQISIDQFGAIMSGCHWCSFAGGRGVSLALATGGLVVGAFLWLLGGWWSGCFSGYWGAGGRGVSLATGGLVVGAFLWLWLLGG